MQYWNKFDHTRTNREVAERAWEYAMHIEPNESKMAALGREGWELVSVAVKPHFDGFTRSHAYFKRLRT